MREREEAKARREEVREEADFYGSMDGASKFVRGDAIAGLLILAINLLGGILILSSAVIVAAPAEPLCGAASKVRHRREGRNGRAPPVSRDRGGAVAESGRLARAREPNLALDHFRALAPKDIHRKRGFDLLEVQFDLPAFAIEIPQRVSRVHLGIYEGRDEHDALRAEPDCLHTQPDHP